MLKKAGLNFLLIAVVSLFVIFAIGSDVTSTPPSTTNSLGTSVAADASESKPDLELLSSNFQSDQYTRYIVGEVKNNSSKIVGYAQITFNLYDDSGAQVGTAFDNISNLEPNGVWKFKCLILEDSATKFKFSGITGF